MERFNRNLDILYRYWYKPNESVASIAASYNLHEEYVETLVERAKSDDRLMDALHKRRAYMDAPSAKRAHANSSNPSTTSPASANV